MSDSEDYNKVTEVFTAWGEIQRTKLFHCWPVEKQLDEVLCINMSYMFAKFIYYNSQEFFILKTGKYDLTVYIEFINTSNFTGTFQIHNEVLNLDGVAHVVMRYLETIVYKKNLIKDKAYVRVSLTPRKEPNPETKTSYTDQSDGLLLYHFIESDTESDTESECSSSEDYEKVETETTCTFMKSFDKVYIKDWDLHCDEINQFIYSRVVHFYERGYLGRNISFALHIDTIFNNGIIKHLCAVSCPKQLSFLLSSVIREVVEKTGNDDIEIFACEVICDKTRFYGEI